MANYRILLTKKQFEAMDSQARYDLAEGFEICVIDWHFNGKYYRVKVNAPERTQKDTVDAFRRIGIIPYQKPREIPKPPPSYDWRDHVVDYYPDD
jgi:hypothetical protein